MIEIQYWAPYCINLILLKFFLSSVILEFKWSESQYASMMRGDFDPEGFTYR
jgi:hypothetical protein